VSLPAVPSVAAGSEAPAGAFAAGERVQRLRTLIAQVEQGPAGFAAALNAAQASSGAAQAGSAEETPALALEADSTAASATAIPAADAQTGAALAGATADAGSGAESYTPLIEAAAARNGLNPAVLDGLIQQESGFDPSATSSAGALGLTQLMPGTAASLGVTEPLNPAQSIEGGARFLGQLMREFGGNVADALAAYNAGPGAVQQYGGVPPYAETQQYVTKVLNDAAAYSQSNDETASAAATSTTGATLA
jgi:soluble lytic murein transglycosylase-like protein